MTPILVGPIMPHRGYYAWPFTTAAGELRRSRRYLERNAAKIARGQLVDRHNSAGDQVILAEDELTLARQMLQLGLAGRHTGPARAGTGRTGAAR